MTSRFVEIGTFFLAIFPRHISAVCALQHSRVLVYQQTDCTQHTTD